MARAKKEAALTPEERLQAALVPDWEWPYKLPENWCWTRIGMVSNFERGITFPAAAKEAAPTEDNIPCLRTANVQENLEIDDMIYVNRDFMKGNIAKLVRENDIIMSSANSRELVGKSSLVTHIPFPMTFGGFVLNIRAKEMSSKYLFYFLRHEFLAGKFIGESSQTTNIANINTTTLGNYEIPLPPLPEQQRIVDRIESLFAKLDEAKEKAQAVVDSFETRKAAILHKAFTGELTAKWREEHGVRMESWEQCSLSDVCTVNPKKVDTKDLPDELEVSFFPMSALSEIYGEITDPQTRLLKEVRSGFTNFSEGDVVFAKITPCMENGKSAVVGKLVNDIGYGTTEFFVLRCSDRLYNRFLYHLVRDKLFRDKAKAVMTGAVGQQRVPKRYLETYKLNLPKFNEQREIVRILDGFFAREQSAKEAAEAVLDQIELMKKSILARAFRGELGTNDPSEESAVKLLRQVIEQEDGDVIRPKAKAKRIAIPAEIKPLLSGSNEEAIVKLLLKAAPQSVSTQTVMSISKKKFELMDALRNLEKKQIVSKSDSGEYSLVR